MQIEAHHSEVIHVSRQPVASVDLASRVQSAAQRFERISALADVWRSELQLALVQCQEFHCTIDNLHEWLSRIDMELKTVDPVDPFASQSELRRKHSELKVFLTIVVYACSPYSCNNVFVLYTSINFDSVRHQPN